MKKICMIVPSFKAKGGITTVVSGYKGSDLENNYQIKYIETYCEGNCFKKVIFALFAYLKFVVLLSCWHPNVIHIHSSFGGSFYRKMPFIVMGHFFSISIVNHIHGSYYDEFFFDAKEKKRRLVRKIYEKCDCIIALSSQAKQELSRIVDKDIAVVENYGIFKHEAVTEREQKENSKTVLFLGFITELKGCFDLPSICERVVKKVPEVKFVVAGVGEVNRLKKEIKDSLLEHFEFPGWISGEEKDWQLRNADIFLLPSYSEGMPMSILDAMGYALPIVATNIGGIPKIVRHGFNGYLTEPGDVETFSEYIISLLMNNKQLIDFGMNSARLIQSEYLIEKHISKLEELYERLENKR